MKRILTLLLIPMLILLGCTQKTTKSGVTSIQIIPGDGLLNLGSSRSFNAIALDKNGNALNLTGFTWTSSDPSVASLGEAQGNSIQVNANKLGSSQISASVNSLTSPSVTVTVLDAVSALAATGAADLVPVLLLGRRLMAGLGLNPAKFAFPDHRWPPTWKPSLTARA
jgi:Bacterial Ig-like domain (group 2)